MDNAYEITYPIHKTTQIRFFDDLLQLSDYLGSYGLNILWVFDTNTSKLFKQLPYPNIVLQAGELYKNFNSLDRILKTCVNESLSRDSHIIGFGGGVVTDMAALASSLYMRGTKLTLVPTSLLCMVDATIGGKTGIDYQSGKNLIGTFYPANEVLICPELLKSLPQKEYMSGLAEVLKHALLSRDDVLAKFLVSRKKQIMDRDPKILLQLLDYSLAIKKEFVEEDFEETKGIRCALNLGHTFGHALEAIGRFTKYTHGEAVAWGCCRALDLGLKLGVTDEEFYKGAYKLFEYFGYDVDYRIQRGEWFDFRNSLKKDKKRAAGQVRFVLMENQGRFRLQSIPVDEIKEIVIASPVF